MGIKAERDELRANNAALALALRECLPYLSKFDPAQTVAAERARAALKAGGTP